MTDETPQISLREQVEFLDSQISLMEEIAKAFFNADLVSKADSERDVAVAKAVRDNIYFEYLIEKAVNAENQAWLEESIC